MNFKLWSILEELKSDNYEWVDLSYDVDEGTPHYHFFDEMKRDIILNVDEHKFNSENYSMISQYGTHVDPPYHMLNEGRTLEKIGVKELIYPLCVIDISKKVAENIDYRLLLEDVLEWEKEHGEVPAGSFVALRSDWHKRPVDKIDGKDENDVFHNPGWGIEALKYLVEEKNIAAIGHETTDTDPADIVINEGWTCEYYILEQDRYQIELLRNLDKLPAKGGIIVSTFPKVTGGAGFTARCFAIIPK